MTYRWAYGEIGEPMWEFDLSSWPDQSVMFYEVGYPFDGGGPPPMTDAEVEALEKRRVDNYLDSLRAA